MHCQEYFKITSSSVLFLNSLGVIFLKFGLEFYLGDALQLIYSNFIWNKTLKTNTD